MAQTIRIDVRRQAASASAAPVLFVPKDQAYYWSHEWQRGEAEADGEIRRGEARRFANIGEALEWLDGGDR